MSEQEMSRRTWLASSAAAVVAGAAGGAATMTLASSPAAAAEPPVRLSHRRAAAFKRRVDAAQAERDLPLPDIDSNGDEDSLPRFVGVYAKALPHNALGEPSVAAYHALIAALNSGAPAAFEQIPLGGVVKLANPQAAYAFELEGADSHHLAMAAPPRFASAEEAGEIGELYWQALTRDVPFANYATDPAVSRAVADLNGFSHFRGPKTRGVVTPGTLFRGPTPGDLVGPYVSQLFCRDIPFGATTIPQRYTTATPGGNFLTTPATWLNAVVGGAPAAPLTFDPVPRYLRSARDLGEFVHRDFSYQAYLSAALILLTFGPGALDPANPYLTATRQAAAVTFGGGALVELLARVSMSALTSAFFYKWLVHRRIRPEEFGGRIHHHLTGAASYPIHSEILSSEAVDEVFSTYGTYFLPQAYPEGCPTHPAYPAAHAVIAGACVTVLKAFFNEAFVIPNPVVASADGLTLVPYTGPALTVGGELDKLASNVAIARNGAGVHWRSDGIEGMKLGEAVAISVLTDRANNFNEPFAGYSLTRFDGTTITVGG